jgi:basic amino acid/polyamine antiporter, APA family
MLQRPCAPRDRRVQSPRLTAGQLARRLGLFDATMIVMGGIVGSGIFMNPSVVARQVRTPGLILAAWAIGGAIALAGAFVYAELAALRPAVGGQYAYLREAFGPLVAFLYGWGLLLVIQSGGMAAVAVTFAHYARELVALPIGAGGIATAVLLALTVVNCLGVRAGATVQSVLMVIKIGAIVGLIVTGLFFAPAASAPASEPPAAAGLVTAMLAALVPVLFAYGGWQTASFVAGELKRPERDLPRGLLLGVLGVVVLYLSVSAVCLRVLGPAALAATTTPASELMRRALGEVGARAIAVGIAVSTLGFLSQSMLTAPRVYYAMATDGLFFRSVARVHPATRVPMAAIALQGILAVVIALSGRYEQILNYVVSVDFIGFGLTGAALFVFRGRGERAGSFRTPGHPLTTAFFVAASFLVVANTVWRYPENTLIGLAILAAGVPAYFLWRRRPA